MEALHARFINLSKTLFDARAIVAEAGNQQRAVQSYMNNVLSTLREEERAKFKTQDINYSPTVKKPVKREKAASSTVSSGGKKPSVKEAKEAAAKYNVPVEMVRTRLIMKSGETADQAAQMIAKKLASIG